MKMVTGKSIAQTESSHEELCEICCRAGVTNHLATSTSYEYLASARRETIRHAITTTIFAQYDMKLFSLREKILVSL